MSIYNWKHYITMNTDLVGIMTEEEADNHWNINGSFNMRVCNQKQLEVINEFGNEVICYIPYYYYLYSKNLLFDNKIKTYKGMECFYYFMNTENIIIKEDTPRHWVCPEHRPLLINNNEHVNHFNTDFWLPPPYKSIFKNHMFVFDKPILIIHNKYNLEWGFDPINYINIDTLDILFNILKDKYQIIYIRPQIGIPNYSYDENQMMDDFGDYELINEKYRYCVIPFTELLRKYNGNTYNELLLRIYANCDNYICVQGGGSYLISYFFKKMVILHIRGPELEDGRNSYQGWFKEVNREENQELVVCLDNESLQKHVENVFEHLSSHKK